MRFFRLLFAVTFLSVTVTFSSAQTFSGQAGMIPDGGTQVFGCLVIGLNPNTIDTVFGLESVTVNINHTNDFDLSIYLLSPDGNYFELSAFNGGQGNDYINTVFKYDAANSVISANAPFTGTFRPNGLMHQANNGQLGNGFWGLVVGDFFANGETGSVVSWSMTFGNNPAKPRGITSSNLPLVYINTNNNAVKDEPKQPGRMGIIYNGPGNRNYATNPFNNYNNNIGIELRGNSSQFIFPQKPFAIETHDVLDSVKDTTILGMPPESDWILYPPYNDRSLLRNALTYKLSTEMGNYASRMNFCEVMINGQYQGVYAMMEKIKRNDKRVEIAKMDTDDNAGDSLTGGYIFKIDWTAGVQTGGWPSNYDGIQFKFHYPKIPTSQQAAFLQAYVDSFENALYGPNFTDPVLGYAKYIDVGTFIDYMLLTEVSKNLDGYRASVYMHKEKINDDKGQLKAGPMWDYNFAYGDNTGCSGDDSTGWEYQTYACDPKVRWWNRLVSDTNYTNKAKCRWTWLRTKTLKTSYVHHYLDSMAVLLNEAQQRHYQQWPILGLNIFGSPVPAPQTYQGEIDLFKQFLSSRMNWMDANLQGTCHNLGTEDLKDANDAYVSIFPNPFQNGFHVNYFLNTTSDVSIELMDPLGRLVKSMYYPGELPGDHSRELKEIANLGSGLYMVKISTGQQVYCRKIIKN
jgi:subtilisin-like proprotein convertase family protein